MIRWEWRKTGDNMGMCDLDTTELWYQERDCLYEVYSALDELMDKMDIPMRSNNRFYEVYWKGRQALDRYKAWQKRIENYEAKQMEDTDD